jgi:hypothetical protein
MGEQTGLRLPDSNGGRYTVQTQIQSVRVRVKNAIALYCGPTCMAISEMQNTPHTSSFAGKQNNFMKYFK